MPGCQGIETHRQLRGTQKRGPGSPVGYEMQCPVRGVKARAKPGTGRTATNSLQDSRDLRFVGLAKARGSQDKTTRCDSCGPTLHQSVNLRIELCKMTSALSPLGASVALNCRSKFTSRNLSIVRNRVGAARVAVKRCRDDPPQNKCMFPSEIFEQNPSHQAFPFLLRTKDPMFVQVGAVHSLILCRGLYNKMQS